MLFSTSEKSGEKKSSKNQQMLLASGIILSLGSLIPEVSSLGKEPLSDRSYGAGVSSEAEDRLFPLGSSLAALRQ